MSNKATDIQKENIIRKLKKVFDFDIEKYKFDIFVFTGRSDAGEFRWYTVGLDPEINSHASITKILRAKDLQYFYNSSDYSGVQVDTGIGTNLFIKSSIPEFRGQKNA